jgi:uncharacterized protein with FMN-binding domain
VRRLVPVLAAAVGAAGLLTAFQSSPDRPAEVAASPITTPATTASPPTTGSTVPRPSTTTAGAPPPNRRSGTAPTTSPPAPATTRPTTHGGSASGTFDGSVEENRYGPVQVRITMASGRITDVQAIQLPSDRARSQRISQIAGPLLREEALRAQSARIDVVSGATYTSQGYARSLQHALDAAGT